MQKISLFHLFILQIQSSLEYRHQTGQPIFDHAHPQNFQVPFNLPEFVPACKSQLIPSVHSRDTFKFSPETRLATPIFDHAQQKNFRSTFNFCEFVSTCKK